MKNVKVANIIKDIRYGYTGSAEENKSNIGFIRVTDINEFGNVDYKIIPNVEIKKNEIERYLLNRGDCIIARSGSVGKAHIYSSDTTKDIFASYLIRLRFDTNKINPKYFGAFTRSELYWKQISSNKQGGVQQNINTEGLLRIEIPLPSLKEQKKIASILEQAFGAIEKRRTAKSLLDHFIRSSFIAIFGNPFFNNSNWEITEFGNCIDYLTSGSRGWAKYYSESGDLFVRIENVGRSKLLLEEKKLQFINAPSNAESKRTKIKEGDLLISITADLGRTAVVPKLQHDAYINQHLALTRLKKGINPTYISYLFSSQFGQAQFQSKNKGGVKAGLNFDDIKTLKIMLPPIILQNKFSDLVRKIDSVLVKQNESEYELNNLFQSLMQKYFN